MKSFLPFLLISIVAGQAQAWRIGGWRGDDPSPPHIPPPRIPVPTITSMTNDVRNGIATVGKATGIDHVLDHNAETVNNLGRAAGCLATLCGTEIIRKNEMDRARADVDAEYKRIVDDEEARQNSANAQDRVEWAQRLQNNAGLRMKLAQDAASLLRGQGQDLVKMKALIDDELQYRQTLAAPANDAKVASSPEIGRIVGEFEQGAKANVETASVQLEAELKQLAESTKGSISRLEAEVLSLIDAATLASADANLGSHIKTLTADAAKVQADFAKAKSDYDLATSQLNGGSSK